MKPNPYEPPFALPMARWKLRRGPTTCLAPYILLTTGTLIALFVFQPPGFASVPYSLLYLIAFPMAFAIVAVIEASPRINAITVVVFWAILLLIHVLKPGTAPGRIQRLAGGILLVLLLASIHLAIQVLPRLRLFDRRTVVRNMLTGRSDDATYKREME